MTVIDTLQTLIIRAKQLTRSYEIVLLTSNDTRTKNGDDYADCSVKAEFLSDEDENVILGALHRIGFSVRQFFDEETFISYVSGLNTNTSNIIVINSAQKGTKIGRKSLIPAICDLYGIRYIGSNPYVVSLCRDKYRCGCILARNEIQVPAAWLYHPSRGWYRKPLNSVGKWIVKPNYEAASIGIDASNICCSDTMHRKVREMAMKYHQEILAEEFVDGYEVEVPIIVSCNKALSFFPVGIDLDGSGKMGERILDYDLRYSDSYDYYDFSNEHPELSTEVLNMAVSVACILNINGFGRVDFRISEGGGIYVTDVATNPHYTMGSSYVFLFERLGFSYDELIACMIAASLEEKGE